MDTRIAQDDNAILTELERKSAAIELRRQANEDAGVALEEE
jgi:hypothetical protein